jgi:phospholipase C
MNRLAVVSIATVLLGAAGFLLSLNGCGGVGNAGGHATFPGLKIQHVVIIFQENRSPDNLFQGLCIPPYGSASACSTNPTASQYDIASSGLASNGLIIPLMPIDLGTAGTNGNPDNYDLAHLHQDFVYMCNLNASGVCQMNGANQIPYQCTKGTVGCPPPPHFQYMYVYPSDVAPYLTMAQTYTFADHMFQTNQGPSFPAHQYILSGTSAISETSTISVADNPNNNIARPDGTFWAGCLAPPGSKIDVIDTSQPSPETPLTVSTQLCYEHPTLTDLLDAASLSWKYYAPSAGSIWTAPDAIQHMCVPTSEDGKFDDTVCSGNDWSSSNPNVVIEGSGAQILTDISNGQLAAVSWVIPTGVNSDHAGNDPDNGPSWVSAIVNAIGEDPHYWGNTAIVVAWDDWGGWFDHVPPPNIRDSYEYGFRVPLIVISAFAKPAYISHVTHDFGSILKFVETAFALGGIDPAVGYADSRSDDLSDCFNFNQLPLVFAPVAAPMSAEHFLHDTSAPTPPDND